MKQIAIIGAGMSGLTLAHKLAPHCNVTVFEKSRGFGGRMATRRAEPYAFDHGAQYFTIRSDEFSQFLQPAFEEGVVSQWDAEIVTLNAGHQKTRNRDNDIFVATPGMSALGRFLAEPLAVKTGVEIKQINKEGEQWSLFDKEDELVGSFDWVIVSAPAPQTARLLADKFMHSNELNKSKFLPGFTLMFGFEKALELPFDGAFVEDSSIGFICVNSSKPERGEGYSLVVQSHNLWAHDHVNADKQELSGLLFEELRRVTGQNFPAPNHRVIHRWLYANVDQTCSSPFLLDEENQLAACGDWCVDGRVEAAFQSGNTLANALVEKFKA